VGTDENGNPIPLSELAQTLFTGKIELAPSKLAVAKDAKVISKEGEEETLFVVGARVAEPDANAK